MPEYTIKLDNAFYNFDKLTKKHNTICIRKNLCAKYGIKF